MGTFLITTVNPEVEVNKTVSSDSVITPSFDRTVSIEQPANYLFDEEKPKVWL